jgi:hypothetical protein
MVSILIFLEDNTLNVLNAILQLIRASETAEGSTITLLSRDFWKSCLISRFEPDNAKSMGLKK